MILILPSAWRQFVENFLAFLIPGPPQITGKTLEFGKQLSSFIMSWN